MKKLFLTILLSSILTLPKTAKAISFYTGIGFGDSKGNIQRKNLKEKHALTFAIGSSFSVPLFPIRVEAEYLDFNSKKDIYKTNLSGGGINTYVNLPLLPILVPYVGLGISYLKEKNNITNLDITKKSSGKIVPQYILGFDLDLPTVIIAGDIEYRYITTNFEFDNTKSDSKYHIFMFKARVKF